MSSTLTKLKINFETFTQCLFLLNGNFECLTTLIVDIKLIYYPVVRIDNTVCKRFYHLFFEINSIDIVNINIFF
jgi:hypothetical protein